MSLPQTASGAETAAAPETQPEGTPALEVRIRHAFSTGFEVDVEFKARSRSLALFGPSGSGKSTILRAIAGLFSPDQGLLKLGSKVLFDARANLDLPPRQRRVGYVVQDGLLFPLLTVRKNLLFGAPREGARLTLERVAVLLEIEHLLDRMPRNLSGGERQRVALGRAVLSEPQALLCDEPFSALDAGRRRRLIPILARIRDELDIPLILVSHNVSEVLALASEVVILEDGKLVAHGPTHGLLATLAEEDGSALNFWEGTVDPDEPGEVHDPDHTLRRVRVTKGVVLHVPLPKARPGTRIRLSVPPAAVTVARKTAETTSARNQLAGSVVAIAPQNGMLKVTVDTGISVTALLTPDAGQELELAAGAEVVVGFKAAAVRILSVSGRFKRSADADASDL